MIFNELKYLDLYRVLCSKILVNKGPRPVPRFNYDDDKEVMIINRYSHARKNTAHSCIAGDLETV